MDKTLREKAIESDIHNLAEEIYKLRGIIKTEHRKEYSVLPNDFWHDVYGRLCELQFMTDIDRFFPISDNDCPDHLLAPSREKINHE